MVNCDPSNKKMISLYKVWFRAADILFEGDKQIEQNV